MRGVGFEPTMSYNNSFTDYRLKPLSHPLINNHHIINDHFILNDTYYPLHILYFNLE